jgi:drug/metabolite transporter (DMT)-like permease
MVFVFVPPHTRDRKVTRRETVTGLFIAALIAICFALFVVLIGPKSGSPPPAIVKWVLAGIAVILAFVGFFTWLRSAGERDDAGQDNNSNEES